MRTGAPRLLVHSLLALLFAQSLALLVYDLPAFGRAPTFVVPVDGWLQGSCFVTAAVVCLLRAFVGGPGSAVWWWIGLALSARAFAFVYYFSVVRLLQPQPYPSVSDGFWLLTVVLMMGGLLTLARGRLAHLTPALALDGVTGVLATAAVTTALLYDTLVERVGAGRASVVVTNMAYPVLDIMLVLVLVGVLAAYAWHPPLYVWALAVGVLGFVVTDGIFLVQVTAGTFHPGTLLSAFTVITNAVIAAAAWLPASRRATTGRDLLPGLVMPTVFAVTCLSVLVLASVHDVPTVSVVFAGLGVLVAILRTSLSFRTLRTVVEHRREARTDELTSLANRRAFNELMEARVRGRDPDRPLALLLVDLDNFKVVNDTLGHHHGDDLLRLVAHRLEGTLRVEDRLARIGGDEFAVVLDGADVDLATQVAERLRSAMRRPFGLASRDVDVSASIGIAIFPENGGSPGDLLQHADLAMYEAKATRSGHSVYRPAPHQANQARLESVERIRRAIDEDEIVLHYQPVVSLVTGEVTGVEALCRWQHPTAGLIPPGGFLPLAESGGLMRSLTLEVLRQAVQQAAVWKQAGTPLRVVRQHVGHEPARRRVPRTARDAPGRLRRGRTGPVPGADRGPVHGRPVPCPPGDRGPAAHRRRPRRRRLRHRVLVAGLPARPERDQWAQAGPLLHHAHRRGSPGRGHRGVDAHPGAVAGSLRGRRGCRDRPRAGQDRVAGLRAGPGLPVLTARSSGTPALRRDRRRAHRRRLSPAGQAACAVCAASDVPQRGQCEPEHRSRSCPQPHTLGVEVHGCCSVFIGLTALPVLLPVLTCSRRASHRLAGQSSV